MCRFRFKFEKKRAKKSIHFVISLCVTLSRWSSSCEATYRDQAKGLYDYLRDSSPQEQERGSRVPAHGTGRMTTRIFSVRFLLKSIARIPLQGESHSSKQTSLP